MSRGLLLNALPREARLSEVMIAAMSLVPYAAAYVADSGVDARRQLRTGSPLACILILPKITRAFLCWSCRRTPAPRSACPKASRLYCAKPRNWPRSATCSCCLPSVLRASAPAASRVRRIRLIQHCLGRIVLPNQGW
jgi:hypothetical protein